MQEKKISQYCQGPCEPDKYMRKKQVLCSNAVHEKFA